MDSAYKIELTSGLHRRSGKYTGKLHIDSNAFGGILYQTGSGNGVASIRIVVPGDE